ncbi:spore coat protein [Clostridium sp. HMP27]|uniref:spore coat protein n=1 Tax=Clostridium sp. HMP27 TaxID=1487921 RepID=UPI00052BD7FA|nr:spore coat protein [Clostridium sp. HMP27]KGK90735.1 spore coat protein F [Clostridium sp. HMP27]
MHNSPNLTEKELMQDLLTSEKQGVTSYATFITETSCPNLRGVLMNNFKSIEGTQYKVFDAMRNLGWYQTQDAPTEDVQTVKTNAVVMEKELK